MLVPVITSTGTPASSSTFNTPMRASPRAAPPERATPTFWARAPHHGSAHARSTRANRFTVAPVRGFEGLQTVALSRQSGGGARRNGTKHEICSDCAKVPRSVWRDVPAMIRRRSSDRRQNLGRRIVRDRRREQEPPKVERRNGQERRSGIARRSGEERRSALQNAFAS